MYNVVVVSVDAFVDSLTLTAFLPQAVRLLSSSSAINNSFLFRV